jgi:signal transduction histidine kinase
MNSPRWTIRTRLSLLYAAVFLASGTVLLGITYGLMRDALYVQQTSTAVVNSPGFGAPATDPATQAQQNRKDQAYEQTLRDEFRQKTLNSITQNLSITLAIVVIGGVAAGSLVARRSLRPVTQITATARRVASGNLRTRIALAGPKDEIRELADTFDDMLGRLDESFDIQRRFVANASHELRTPLAINRTLIEVAMGRPGCPPELLELGTSLLQVNERQQMMIDGLLALAESEQSVLEPVGVDLADVVESAVRVLEHEADQRGVTVTVAAEPAWTTGDTVLLERLATNLVQNAIRHNEPGGQASVGCSSTDHGVEIRVTNTGATVEAYHLEEIFEPFRRRTARVDSRQGSGLGLSIVRAVARAHGGVVTAEPREGGGLVVVATLPRRLTTVGEDHDGP